MMYNRPTPQQLAAGLQMARPQLPPQAVGMQPQGQIPMSMQRQPAGGLLGQTPQIGNRGY